MGDNLGVLVCYRLVSWNIQPVGSICDLFRLGSSWVVEMEEGKNMLKKKLELNYRRAVIAAEGSRFKRCKFCKHKQVMEIRGIGGNSIGHGYRCPVIGLENSNRYVVQDDHVCDGWEAGKR